MIPAAHATDPWRWRLLLCIYRLLSPLLLVIALPAWLRKMMRRDGWSTPIAERFGLYRDDIHWTPCGHIHVHAVSVGETLIALKFLRLLSKPAVLAVSTATAWHVAHQAHLPNVTVVYAPLDLYLVVHGYLKRFEPKQIILVEAEAWPELMQACQQQSIPVAMINARLSARSEKRYRALRTWISPLFQKISRIGVQDEQDKTRFAALGIDPASLHVTGSIKFDPLSAQLPQTREEFSAILSPIQANRTLVLAASTHDGEEVLMADALRDSGICFACVPRHAERRHEVRQALNAKGFSVWLRSDGIPPAGQLIDVLIIDSTGELRDWTAHADIVIIGKSFLSTGGQNPAEAILAKKPVIVGPHMENFEPLMSQLLAANAAVHAPDAAALCAEIKKLLDHPENTKVMCEAAASVLQIHAGATERSASLING
jgi:3-deoxy-D-manno-octulosonic-acid transferase